MRHLATMCGVMACAALALSGCAATAYKDEAASVGKSASALASAIPSGPAVKAEGAAVLDIVTDELMLGAPILYTGQCGDDAFAAHLAFVRTAAQAQDAQDAAFKPLLAVKACGVQALAPPPPEPAKPAPGAKDGAPKPKTDAGAEAQLLRDEQLQAARDQAARRIAQTPDRTAPRPVCSGACDLDDYLKAISDYGAAIQAAATAQSVSDAQTQLSSASTAVDGLLKLAKAPPLASAAEGAVTALAKLGVQQAQYAAMKAAVLRFGDAWPSVAPAVKTAARLRIAQLIDYRADASEAASLSAQAYLNDRRYYASPIERLQLFGLLNGKVEAAAAALKSAQADPGAAIDAFSTANTALALAMEHPKTQGATLLADLKAAQDQITALQKAAAPAKTGASHGG